MHSSALLWDGVGPAPRSSYISLTIHAWLDQVPDPAVSLAMLVCRQG